MLSKEQIHDLFSLLNDRLAEKGELGEIGVIGGAAMCIAFDARKSTQDVDAIFKPAAVIRKLAQEIGEEKGMDKNWLNDAAKGFLNGNFLRKEILALSHLKVWAPEPRYMLAMKCLSARWDSMDKKDVIFLLELLKIKKPKDVFSIIEGYYPKERIPPKTQFFIEELLG